MDTEKVTWQWIVVAILAGFAWAAGDRLFREIWPEKKEAP
jgi:hypothetical protein